MRWSVVATCATSTTRWRLARRLIKKNRYGKVFDIPITAKVKHSSAWEENADRIILRLCTTCEGRLVGRLTERRL